tara:strand:+ start:276 stop:449 length:174 start_codon:yes stop_codon:yes gene_type:complete
LIIFKPIVKKNERNVTKYIIKNKKKFSKVIENIELKLGCKIKKKMNNIKLKIKNFLK